LETESLDNARSNIFIKSTIINLVFTSWMGERVKWSFLHMESCKPMWSSCTQLYIVLHRNHVQSCVVVRRPIMRDQLRYPLERCSIVHVQSYPMRMGNSCLIETSPIGSPSAYRKAYGLLCLLLAWYGS